MSPTRAVFLILMVLSVVFAVFVWLGNGNSQIGQHASNEELASRPLPSWMAGFGGVLAPFAPKLKLDQNRFSIAPLNPTSIVIASGENYRRATFRLLQGQQMNLVLQVQPSDTIPSNLQTQNLVLLRQDANGSDDPQKGNLLIPASGGSLYLTCSGVQLCVVELE
jgi:hypothetical protein